MADGGRGFEAEMFVQIERESELELEWVMDAGLLLIGVATIGGPGEVFRDPVGVVSCAFEAEVVLARGGEST